MLDIAVRNTLKQYFLSEKIGMLISYIVIEKSQFLFWGVYYSPPCIIRVSKNLFSESTMSQVSNDVSYVSLRLLKEKKRLVYEKNTKKPPSSRFLSRKIVN